MMIDGPASGVGLRGEQTGDWVLDAWQALPDRWKTVVARRSSGETLGSIAESLGLTRERLRQLQKKAEGAVSDAQRRFAPELPEKVSAVLRDRPAVPDSELIELLPTSAKDARRAIFRQLGASHPRSWSGDLSEYWTRHPLAFRAILKEIVGFAPMSNDEAELAASDLGLPSGLSIQEILADPASSLIGHSLGWIRRGRAGRDLAYLWLRVQGEPQAVVDVADIAGTSEHAIRETMRRDSDFSQIRPEGTWALADWRIPGSDSRYSSAVDAVVEVLRELGPLSYDELRTESQRRYPVSSWRISQCLSSAAIGLTGDGLYDLSERGAIPIEDPEPAKPSSIQVQGNVVGVELDVDYDMLRGSGISVNRWLTWHLGLRTAPSARYFDIADQQATLSVKRATSASQISSLRAVVRNVGLVEGCKVVILLHVDTETAIVRHACPEGTCAAT